MDELIMRPFDPVGLAVERWRHFEPSEGYYGAFSGGKDSVYLYETAKIAGVKVDWHYHWTTMDPAEVVYFIKEFYPDVIIEKPETTIWKLIEHKGIPPTRMIRYCCPVFKEIGGVGRFVATGVRWAESSKRKKNRAALEILTPDMSQKMLMNDNDEARRMLETCQIRGKRILNPVIDSSDEDVWRFIKNNGVPYLPLYDEGFTRIGCIGCPMATMENRIREFQRWPKYYDLYLRTFERMLIHTEEKKKKKALYWKSAQDVMNWWLYEGSKEDPDQLKMFDEDDF